MSEWINVKDRLPEEGAYLCCLGYEVKEICYYDGDQWEDSELAIVTPFVTHWMPLPDLPREDCNG